MSLDGAILLGDDALMGETADELQRGIDAGVIYICREPDGQCPNGNHRGGPFLHYCDGYGPDDYDAL